MLNLVNYRKIEGSGSRQETPQEVFERLIENGSILFNPSNKIRPEPDKWYWVIYECRLSVVRSAPMGNGFFAAGQEPLWSWLNAIVLMEVDSKEANKLSEIKVRKPPEREKNNLKKNLTD